MAERERLETVDLGELTLGELALLELGTGQPLSRLQADSAEGGEGIYRVPMARALGFIQLRRRTRAAGQPDPTWDDVDELLLPESGDDDAGEVATTTPDPIPAGRRKRTG